MSTRESGRVGIDHLTVVPENLERDPAPEEEPTAGRDAVESAADDEE